MQLGSSRWVDPIQLNVAELPVFRVNLDLETCPTSPRYIGKELAAPGGERVGPINRQT